MCLKRKLRHVISNIIDVKTWIYGVITNSWSRLLLEKLKVAQKNK
jgi:hypothetical protein